MNHIASSECPGLTERPSKESTSELSSAETFSTISREVFLVKDLHHLVQACFDRFVDELLVDELLDFERQVAQDHRQREILIGRVPGCALHHLPLGFERFSSTRSKVFLAMAAYPASPEAMASCAKAIVAKVYEKML